MRCISWLIRSSLSRSRSARALVTAAIRACSCPIDARGLGGCCSCTSGADSGVASHGRAWLIHTWYPDSAWHSRSHNSSSQEVEPLLMVDGAGDGDGTGDGRGNGDGVGNGGCSCSSGAGSGVASLWRWRWRWRACRSDSPYRASLTRYQGSAWHSHGSSSSPDVEPWLMVDGAGELRPDDDDGCLPGHSRVCGFMLAFQMMRALQGGKVK